jgi:hypothetical protein
MPSSVVLGGDCVLPPRVTPPRRQPHGPRDRCILCRTPHELHDRLNQRPGAHALNAQVLGEVESSSHLAFRYSFCLQPPQAPAAALPRRDPDPPCPSPTAAVSASDPVTHPLSSSTSSASIHPPPPLLTQQTEVTRAQVDALKAELRDLEAQLAATGINSACNPPPPLSPPTAVAPTVNYATCMALSAARRDLAHMEAVFNRHAKPVGLSAKALVFALHAIDPSSFSAEVSDADAKKLMKQVDNNNKGHATFEELCRTAKISCDEGTEASPARDEFLRFADVKVLSAFALMDALKEVDAPVLLSDEGCSPEQIFRRADADISGSVDLAE